MMVATDVNPYVQVMEHIHTGSSWRGIGGGEKYITLRLVYYLSHGGTISVDVWGDI